MKQKSEKINQILRASTILLALVIFVCSIALIKKDIVLSLVMLVCSFIIGIDRLILYFGRQKKMKEYISDAALDDNELQNNEALFKSMNPIAGIRADGSIAWYNSSFKELFGIIGDEKISDVIKEIDMRQIYKDGGKTPIIAKVGEDTYNILTAVKRKISPDHASVMIYMDKVTQLLKLKNDLYSAQIAVAHIVIDNYDEALDDADDEEKFEIIALLDKNVIGWAQDAGCLIKKMEKNKFLCVLTRKELEIFVKNKFDILQNLKSFNPNAKIPPTASIGIGVGESSFTENDVAAKKALEMALGRGGDQVVIREKGKFSYYGGNTKETEKRTKVKARVMAHNLRELIDDADNVLVMGHRNSDADSIGAAIGIAGMASFIKKDAKILLMTKDDAAHKLLQKIEENHYHDGMFIEKNGLRDFVTPKTLLVICDTHVPEFTEMPELITAIKRKVVIDHHRRSENFIEGADLVFHEPFASSTCEMVAEIMQYFDSKYSVPTIDAEVLYTGIAVDTKNFTFKTGVRTFEAAAYLRSAGVDTIRVKKLFRESIDDYKLKASIVTEAQIYKDNIAISIFPEVVPHIMVAAAADEMLQIADIKASFAVAFCENGSVSISGRSLGDVNVQVILEKLGGGGHMMVAGAQITGKSIEDVGALLRDAIDEVFDV